MVQRAKTTSFSLGLAGMLTLFACVGGCASSAAGPSANAPAPAAASPSPTSEDGLSHGGASLFVVHLLSDFDGFKKYFEDGAPARARAGIQGHLLTRLDDGRVVVHLFGNDAEQLKAALASPEMDRYLDRKGAPESSLVWLTENELFALPKNVPSGPTYSLFLKLRVSDFSALAQGFKQNLPLFAQHEVIAEGLHRSTSQEQIAILHFVGNSREKLALLVERPEFWELLSRAGSREEVKPLLGLDVSRSRPGNE